MLIGDGRAAVFLDCDDVLFVENPTFRRRCFSETCLPYFRYFVKK